MKSVVFMLIGLIALSARSANAEARYSGRFTFGSYVSSETFLQATDGATWNDFATASSRFFVNVQNISTSGLNFTADLRDKHDFFDKLDSENLALTGTNSFQVRRLSVNADAANYRVIGSVGRFAVDEAGTVQTDGVELGYKIRDSLRVAGFAGFNPRSSNRSYLEFNKDQSNFGLWTSYQPQFEKWGRYFRQSNALVVEQYKGQTDRAFWYQNLSYQWRVYSQFNLLLYLDFVPRTNVQNANLSYTQVFFNSLQTSLGASRIDVIEYARRQAIRDHLTPSPYTETSLTLSQRISGRLSVRLASKYGVRSLDSKKRNEFALGLLSTQLFSTPMTGKIFAISRKNFTAQDTLGRLELEFFLKKWEGSAMFETGISRDETSGLLHPKTGELGLAYLLSKELYTMGSLQYTSDENVRVLSGFFKLGYRFGNKELTPLRDGAPPLGTL